MPVSNFVSSGSQQYDVLVETQIWSTLIFPEMDEGADVESSLLPWITDPVEDRSGILKGYFWRLTLMLVELNFSDR
jgi:hypothetical protein